MNGENIALRKVRDSDGFEPTDGKGFHEGLVWDDIIIPPSGLAAVQNIPGRITIKGGLQGYGFDGGSTTEELNGSFELSHGYKEGTDLRPHIHWLPINTNAGSVKWQLEYTIANVDTTMPNTVTVSGLSASAGVAFRQQAVETGAISGTGLKIGAQCHFRLFRNPTDPQDTYASDAILSSFGVHYQIDGDGSRNVFVK